ncbi:MAG: hypothetical protein JSW32_04000, partial [Deltaproteobacteria bacterium]
MVDRSWLKKAGICLFSLVLIAALGIGCATEKQLREHRGAAEEAMKAAQGAAKAAKASAHKAEAAAIKAESAADRADV